MYLSSSQSYTQLEAKSSVCLRAAQQSLASDLPSSAPVIPVIHQSPWPLIFLIFPISDSSLPLHLLLSQLCKTGAYLMRYFAK